MQSNLSPVLYNQEQFLSFKLSERIYSINIKFVKEIVKYKSVSLTFLPFTPDYIDGIINLRGEFVTILNLKRFLNLPDEEQAPPKGLIVLNSREYKLAISADEIQNISYINNDKLNYSAQSKVDSKYVMAELVEDDCVYNILNVEKILNDDKLFINVEN
jgi:purine-binding chemotaxis protein CheW